VRATQEAAFRDRKENERQLAEARAAARQGRAEARQAPGGLAATDPDGPAPADDSGAPPDAPTRPGAATAAGRRAPADSPEPEDREPEPDPEPDPATAPTTPLFADRTAAPDEHTIRLVAGRRRVRHRIEDETEPAQLAPGATEMGARSISDRADAHRVLEPQRIGALIALLIAIAAFVLVVVLRVGPI
jgi:hypothetical protein